MDKEFRVAKWLLIVRPKKTQSPSKKIQPKMCAQAQKFEIFENSSLWVSVVRGRHHQKSKENRVFYVLQVKQSALTTESPSGHLRAQFRGFILRFSPKLR